MSLSADLNLAFKSQEGGDMKGKLLLTNTVAYKSVITCSQVSIGFEMLVLTSGAWPLNQSSAGEFTIPAEVRMIWTLNSMIFSALNLFSTLFRLSFKLVRSISKFEEFYKKKHSGRRLTWLWHLSRGSYCGLH